MSGQPSSPQRSVKVDQIVIEWVTDPRLLKNDGTSYWGFSAYVGEELAGCGSADDLGTVLDMAKETVEAIESETIWKGIKVRHE